MKEETLHLKKQHLHAKIFANHLLYLKKHYPHIDTNEIVTQCGLSPSYLASSSSWVSTTFAANFTNILIEKTGDANLDSKVAAWAVSREGLPAPEYMAVKAVTSVRFMYLLMVKQMFPRANKVVNLRVVSERKGLLEIELMPILAGLDNDDASALVENFPNIIHSICGYFQNFPLLLNMPAAKIQSTLSADANGTPYCQLKVNYINFNALGVTFFYLFSFMLGFATFIFFKSSLSHFLSFCLASIWVIFAILFRYRSRLRGLQSIATEAQKSYADLQNQYSETYTAKLALDRSLREQDVINMLLRNLIQARTSGEVIENGCIFLVENFGFDRVAVFQVNETKDSLIYQYGFSREPNSLSFFSSLVLPTEIESSDPSKLTNVYRFKKSLLIEDCQSHMTNLSDEGKRFLIASQSQSFLAVPIVANENCFGIFVIDAFFKRAKLTEGDLALAEKVSNAVAAALEKNQLQAAREEALERSNKFKDQVLANTSHELRTPINGIVNFARIVRESSNSQICEADKEFLKSIEHAGGRLSRLVNNILEQSAQDYGNMAINFEVLNIYEIVCAVVVELEIANDRTAIKIIIDEKMQNLWVKADKDKLFQVLINLLQNALKFTLEGSIRITAELQNSEVLVSVVDTGVGIPDSDLERVFEPFVKSHTRGKQEGVGLGLAITKNLIVRMGGRISAHTFANQPGTCIKFSLPAAENVSLELDKKFQTKFLAGNALQSLRAQGALPKRLSPNALQKSQDGSDPLFPLGTAAGPAKEETLILVVDDEPMNLQILGHFLESAQLKTVCAPDGQAALDLIAGGLKPHLILLDIMMPGLDGYAVCEQLRKEYSAMILPILMMSAKQEVVDVLQGFRLGANDYIGKPFVKEVLLARVLSHLGVSYVSRIASRFVPWELVHLLGAKNLTEVQVGKGAEFEIAVFYLDLRKFTDLLESMPCSDAFYFLNSFLGHVVPTIIKHKGIVDKYIGDCVMGVFLSADAALAAAIEVQQSMKAYNLQHRSGGKRRFVHAGVGIHWGKAFVGAVGISKRLDVTVVSDAVNTGSRLQELTKTYGADVVISQAIAQRASSAFSQRFRYIDEVQIRGRKESVKVYSVDTDQELDLNLQPAQSTQPEQSVRFGLVG